MSYVLTQLCEELGIGYRSYRQWGIVCIYGILARVIKVIINGIAFNLECNMEHSIRKLGLVDFIL